jgi:hypothetical protein
MRINADQAHVWLGPGWLAAWKPLGSGAGRRARGSARGEGNNPTTLLGRRFWKECPKGIAAGQDLTGGEGQRVLVNIPHGGDRAAV